MPQPHVIFLSLLGGIGACCLVFTVANWFEFVAIRLALMALFLSVLTPFVWLYGAAFAPELTKYVTVLVVVAIGGASLLGCWLQQSREMARRNQCSEKISRIAHKIVERHDQHLEIPSFQTSFDLESFLQTEAPLPRGR